MKYLSKQDFTILLGNVVDHFDRYLYVFLAPVLAPLFFPNSDPIIALIIAYSILATSIITRPIGVYVFGMIAKIHGPTKALSNSLIGVGFATLSIGLLPDYNLIGAFAPVLLVIFRMFRDVFAEGENAVAKLYILQDKSTKEAFNGSYLYQASTVLGIAFASLASTLVHYSDYKDSWRICYFLGGGAAIVGYVLRKSAIKIDAKKSDSLLTIYSYNGLKTIWKYRADCLRIAVVNSFSHLTYVLPFVTMNSLIPLISNIDIKDMMLINSCALFFDILAIPIAGRMLSNIAPKKIMMASSFVLALTIVPLWYFLDGASFLYVTCVRLWILVLGVVFLCPLNLWCAEQIKGDEQYMIVGMGATIGAITVGKLTPAICLALYYYSGSHVPIAFYVMSISILVGLVMKGK